MAGIPKEHDKLYFDVLCRTQKLETVLSLIHATYQAKKSGVSDIKTEIAKRLENAYNLFKTNIRGTDSGSGSYSGTMKQFESQYTIGHELCIWSNSNLDLTSYALAVAKGNMTIREYFDIFFLSYFQPIANKGVPVLYLILKYMIDKSTSEINKDQIPFALGIEAEREDINALCNFLSDTSYIEYDGKKLIYVGKEAIETFIKRCNTSYLGEEGLIKARAELNTEEKYIAYIMSGKLQSDETKEEIDYSLTINELGEILSKMYNDGAKIVGIHLFGIRYGKYIRKMKYGVSDIIKASGIKESYFAEVNKGISLSNYVKEIVDISNEESNDSNTEYLEDDYVKFRKLLGWFVNQLNINNGIEEGIKTSGKGYLGEAIQEKYSEWRDYGTFTLDCTIQSGYLNTSGKANYINKTDTGINIRPKFDKKTKEVKYLYIDVYENNKKYGEDISIILEKEYELSNLGLSDDLEPNDFLKELFDDFSKVVEELTEKTIDTNKYDECERKTGGENIILYGVPGAGKSWTIESYYRDENTKMQRVVFHPDYTYSDFVGQILPQSKDGNVSYDFIPGPFTKIVNDAYRNPNQKFILVIEEINRGNAPAIFGDIFQLLDRNKNGRSSYEISNADVAKIVYRDENHPVYLPSNLSIICTMNTSDQNVFTLDTAFQRRWSMRLIENTFKKDTPEEKTFAEHPILDSDIKWEAFCETINAQILEKNQNLTSSEDKRLGTHFVTIDDLIFDINENNVNITQAERSKAILKNRRFPEKVIKYLWDDTFKFYRDEIFKGEFNSLEKVINEFTSKSKNDRFNIFKDNIKAAIEEANKS